jgi:pimeloyl-[acyl-carrier protein] methyl ester esterase
MRLILLPGFDGTGALFAPFLHALPPEMEARVIPFSTDRICSAAELVGQVLSNLPDDVPYVLIAESFSGPIALKASASHCRPPVAVILCASFAVCPVPGVALKALGLLARAFSRLRPPRWLVRRYLLGEAPDHLVELFYSTLATVSPRVLAHRLSILREFTAEFRPLRLSCPLLYLQATQDRLVGAHNLDFVRQCYPTVTVVEIDSPHLVLQVQPAASIRAISDFLAGLAPNQG